jgi:radical SAM protein
MSAAEARPAPRTGYVYDRAPMLIYWELTRACDLACLHCRAEAVTSRDPDELTTDDALAVLRQVVEFGAPYPHVVFTGGDPLKRPDLFLLLEAAQRAGIGASLAPSGTALLTRDAITGLRAAGVQSISLSLDGATADRHDAFRGVPGCFETTMRAAACIVNADIPLQINTLVTADTARDLPAILSLLAPLPIMRWSLFFLIGVGRGAALRELEPEAGERLMRWLFDLMPASPFAIKTTEAPHFRRVALQRMRALGWDGTRVRHSSVGRGFGVRDGNGIVFISWRGDVTPSGFLPVRAGNVRGGRLAEAYRSAPTFVALRDAVRFKGRCGRCEFRQICGGSRARAFAHMGDYLESDPFCPYVPA